MDSIGALMQGIFSFNKMIDLPNPNAITSRNNSRFIKLIVIFPQRFLRPYEERINAFLYSFICIATTCPYFCNIMVPWNRTTNDNIMVNMV